MPFYLYQVAYKPEAWAGFVKRPQNRANAIRPVLQGLRGRLVNFYLSFGEYDAIAIAELPNSSAAAAFSVAVSAGGAVKAIKTTPLMTAQEGLEVMRRAGRTAYKPPR